MCSSNGSGFGACECAADANGPDVVQPTDASDGDSSVDAKDAGPWTPKQLAGLRVWLVSDVGVNPAPFSWADQSGNGNDATGTNSNVQVIANAIQGHPVVRVVTNVLTIKDAPSIQFGTQTFQIVIVGAIQAGGAWWDKATAGAGLSWNVNVVNSQQSMSVVTGTPTAYLTVPSVNNLYHYLQLTAPTLALGVDGVWTTGPTATCDMSVVGTDVQLASSNGHVDVAEVLVIAGALSGSDQTSLDTYVAERYGL
jgi:hypothetical protein